MLTPVLLCGGVGSRLWPLSRENRPKQFLSLVSGRSMLAETLDRLGPLDAGPPLVTCGVDHRFLVAEQLREAGDSGLTGDAAILLEPRGRNTAPALAVAALKALQSDPDAILLALPADHWIAEPEVFHAAVRRALPLAEQGRLLSFGVAPTRPETGYGYIRPGQSLGEGLFELDRFVEKPDPETARKLVDSGEYLWNSGQFLLSAAAWVEELRAFAPDMLAACERAVERAVADADFLRLDPDSFAACPANSIDYAVMEKTDRGAVVELNCGWSDLGDWGALWEIAAGGDGNATQNDLPDGDVLHGNVLQDNVLQGNVLHGDVLVEGGRDNYLRSESRLLAAVGVRDLVVVETPDAVLVAHRDAVQDIRRVVSALKSARRPEVGAADDDNGQ